MNQKIYLTAKQEAYLIRHYKNTMNKDLLAWLRQKGVEMSRSTLKRFAKIHGLRKSSQHLNKCRRKNISDLLEYNKIHGFENQTRGVIEMHKRFKASGEYPKGYFKKGENNLQRFGADKCAETNEKVRLKRNSLIKREKRRLELGLEPISNLKLGARFTARESRCRHYAKVNGYFVFEENAIYYGKETERARHTTFERYLMRDGIPLLPLSMRGKNFTMTETIQNAGTMTD